MILPAKGTGEERVARRIAKWLNDLGEPRVTPKGDNEPAMLAFMRKALQLRANVGGTLFEHPPRRVRSNPTSTGSVGSGS